ncbi:MAG: acyl-CoA dehydrogenase family protein [Myxococcales bacterium]|nr:acyl-CoA dehydrogenase family protein [Myxococcales bacterium]MDH3484267.1 acyl-CoA dehydrogenase family protein [Myxococcales bacterium]
MELQLSEKEKVFRDEARAWLEQQLNGPFKHLQGRGASGDQDSFVEERIAWGKVMGAAGWNCIGWPKEFGGRGCTIKEEAVFNEEYVRANGPGNVGHIGETLLGPTLIHFGTPELQKRFLPPIISGEEIWCQGYSEPGAGSDLASVQTKATLEGKEWVIEGQKIWTSGAQYSDWCFVLCRTDPEAPKHRGISCILVPMKQAGIEVRPIKQMGGGAEFAEVFFDGARTSEGNVVGGVNNGWKVAMGTLAFERGASTLSQQYLFQKEFEQVIATAKHTGAAKDPVFRQRLADAWIGLKIMRVNALRMLEHEGTDLNREALISKLYWSNWHRDLGKLAMDLLGAEGEMLEAGPYELTGMQKWYLFSRADTIYAGSNQIQRNIIGERGLGLPKEPR